MSLLENQSAQQKRLAEEKEGISNEQKRCKLENDSESGSQESTAVSKECDERKSQEPCFPTNSQHIEHSIFIESATGVSKSSMSTDIETEVEQGMLTDTESGVEKQGMSSDTENKIDQPEVSTDTESRVEQPGMSIDTKNRIEQPRMSSDTENRIEQPRMSTGTENRVELPAMPTDIENGVEQPGIPSNTENTVEQLEMSTDTENTVEQRGMATNIENGVEKPGIPSNTENRVEQPEMSTDTKNRVEQPGMTTDTENRIEQPEKSTGTENRVEPLGMPTDFENRLEPSAIPSNTENKVEEPDMSTNNENDIDLNGLASTTNEGPEFSEDNESPAQLPGPALVDAVKSLIPSTWKWDSENGDATFEQVHKYSKEYERIQKMIQKTLDVELLEVKLIKNPFLWGAYQLKKLECEVRKPNEYYIEELFHATGRSEAQSISKDNLDWRRVTRCKYGLGVSFSRSADYANTFCNRDSGRNRAMLIVDVIMNKTVGDSHLPTEDCDTSGSGDGNVLVKFMDNEFYPKYMVLYRSPSIPSRNLY